MTTVICVVCGREGARLVKAPFDAIYNKIPIRLEDVERYECDRCGESTFDPGQDKAVSDRVKAKSREHLGLLPPEAIVGIRKRCNLSQEDMEGLFGVEKKAVGRWEGGRSLQSKTADVLLRLMDRNPDIVEELRKVRP